MLELEVAVPVACFRRGFAREFWESEDLPPPATCYGFLSLSWARRTGVAMLGQGCRAVC